VNDSTSEDGVEDTGTFLYYKPWHDRFNKLVLGHYLPHDQQDMKDGQDVLDILASHPATAHHIAFKLCRRLISDQPPDDVVAAAAAVFLEQVNAADQLRQVVRFILLSDAFAATWGEKVKTPFEALVSGLRALNYQFSVVTETFWYAYEINGQPLFGHHAPNGYPDIEENWTTTTSLLYRWKLIKEMIEGRLSESGVSLSVDLSGQMPKSLQSAEDMADYWITRLLGRPFDNPDSRNAVVQLMAGDIHSRTVALMPEWISQRLPKMVELILFSPEFQRR
jgi:hypothetical protein